MSGMFWIALKLSIPKIGLKICYLYLLKSKTRLNLTESRNPTALSVNFHCISLVNTWATGLKCTSSLRARKIKDG